MTNSTEVQAVPVGIDDISFATGSYRVDLADIAPRLGAEPAKYHKGLGQEQMSVVGADEDPVTMAAAAAAPLIERHGAEGIRTLMFATETGIDQSKSAGVYVHELLGLPPAVRTVELKQACYSATAALQFAAALVTRNPKERVLVVASDIARYDLDSAAEPTQGAGAVAFIVSANPRILRLDAANGVHTDDVMDFWRPNYRSQALVEGKLSISAYIDAVAGAYEDYRDHDGAAFSDIDYFCYHQPFTKMASKAHLMLAERFGVDMDKPRAEEIIAPTTGYNRRVGNSYTASTYFGLLSLLDTVPDLAGRRVALASYGSGCVAEFLTGVVVDGYEQFLRTEQHEKILADRVQLDDPTYYALQQRTIDDPGNYANSGEGLLEGTGPFAWTGVEGHRRRYSRR
ncbi:hydroxymethylglutaryl-CoA synthase [Corynebacterium sp. TAE3-ERU12]|uniref:hydroxymethylglutaryl-CoA synthase n=1 Tax=Corynebacterium sp. TAE3-ERU12 TaxID=2849491 RepID=UPI001C47F9EA|nr:hydroxymethylglutaryl-CoA synthase [Corynebacterium sp. TAE3-ERU12]MBV7294707.1 hydroxymethylglutaryl-CoA synthase [Corynebacterium sp. TAE3-ERU12]